MKIFNSKEKIILLFENKQNLELQKCYDICKYIAKAHYENFPVGSLLIPKNLRKHFYAIYSFARIADDISDENYFIDKNEKLFYLDNFKNSLINNNYLNPIIKALNNTIQEKNLPYEPFIKLIDAFRYDVDFEPFKNWDEILRYCDNSANPIGELILRLFNNYDNEIKKYSDAICSGLQLINFWQDLSVDILKGRNYIPIDLLDKYGIKSLDINSINKSNIQQLLNEIYDYTEKFYKFGFEITNKIKNKRLKLELKITILGGYTILKKVSLLEEKILINRPKLNKFDILKIILNLNKYYEYAYSK